MQRQEWKDEELFLQIIFLNKGGIKADEITKRGHHLSCLQE